MIAALLAEAADWMDDEWDPVRGHHRVVRKRFLGRQAADDVIQQAAVGVLLEQIRESRSAMRAEDGDPQRNSLLCDSPPPFEVEILSPTAHVPRRFVFQFE